MPFSKFRHGGNLKMEDAVFQSQLYHDAVSVADEIEVGDMVAWEHDESVKGQVVEIVKHDYALSLVKFKPHSGEIRVMDLDECVPA